MLSKRPATEFNLSNEQKRFLKLFLFHANFADKNDSLSPGFEKTNVLRSRIMIKLHQTYNSIHTLGKNWKLIEKFAKISWCEVPE